MEQLLTSDKSEKMKILFIVPGAGDAFYCGNCFRDNLHANALRKAGHDVVIMPLYLPLNHKSFKADTPLFFPAASFYVAQKFFSRKPMPRWMERILNSQRILNLASSFSGSTSAEGMEEMTLSMINGDDAVFNTQVAQLVEWIVNCEKPDIIHLSSTLIGGVAKAVKQNVNIPIVCSMQDEEVWIQSLKPGYDALAWKGIEDNLKYIDKFVVSSGFYKDIISAKIPQIKDIDIIYPGIDIRKYASEQLPQNPTVGFFYRMNKDNGLDILAEAFVMLKKRNSIKNLKLKIGGGYTSKDKRFLKQVKKTLSPCIADVEFSHNYSLDEHTKFYGEITVISVPITFDEGVGLYLCEAFAAGRPAVEPDTGSFREITENAGVLYSPNNSASLADAIEKILTNDELFA
ncbi:MAG: glycosyltransferase family 4 protein, partial [Prevotellaceae bacterium]|nr:glycosyltransferase family 4 protein [Prevotellaceae bacterium]